MCENRASPCLHAYQAGALITSHDFESLAQAVSGNSEYSGNRMGIHIALPGSDFRNK
jgi:hypothetical protein